MKKQSKTTGSGPVHERCGSPAPDSSHGFPKGGDFKSPPATRGSSGIGPAARWQLRWVQSPVFALLAKFASSAIPESETFGTFGNKPSVEVPNETTDLKVALETMQQLGLDDGDIGYRYWYDIAELLKSAAAMRTRIEELELKMEELSRKHVPAPSSDSGKSPKGSGKSENEREGHGNKAL